jgi:hypothetical protein
LVQEFNLMGVEFLSNIRYDHMVQPRDWEFWLKRLGELQEFLRQPPAEPPRVIEILEVPQSDQQIAQSGVPDTEMHDIHDADITDIAPSNARNVPDFDISDVPGPAMNDASDPEMQRSRHDGMKDLPNNDSEFLEDAMTNALDGESDMQTSRYSQDIENDASLEIDTYAFEPMDTSFANLLPSPPFPSILTMELPPPALIAGDKLLEWRSIDSSELQEGPIPDLDTFLDPSLWEDDWELSQLDPNSVPLLEQAGAALAPHQPPR